MAFRYHFLRRRIVIGNLRLKFHHLIHLPCPSTFFGIEVSPKVLQESASVEPKLKYGVFGGWRRNNAAVIAEFGITSQAEMLIGIFGARIDKSQTLRFFILSGVIAFVVIAGPATVVKIAPCENQISISARTKVVDFHGFFAAESIVGSEAVSAAVAEQYSKVRDIVSGSLKWPRISPSHYSHCDSV
ncbi:MAG: hypothetical protein WEB58_01925 [Planctomycetaceae bacterium]